MVHGTPCIPRNGELPARGGSSNPTNGVRRAPIPLNRRMDVAAEQDAQEAEATLVLSWRYGVLREAGYDADHAFILARASVDVHVAADLLARGCPPRTALEILL